MVLDYLKYNRVVMLVDDLINNDKKINNGMCMDFLKYIDDEPNKKECFFEYWNMAKSGQCPYKSKCPRYARTLAKHPTYSRQLDLFASTSELSNDVQIKSK